MPQGRYDKWTYFPSPTGSDKRGPNLFILHCSIYEPSLHVFWNTGISHRKYTSVAFKCPFGYKIKACPLKTISLIVLLMHHFLLLFEKSWLFSLLLSWNIGPLYLTLYIALLIFLLQKETTSVHSLWCGNFAQLMKYLTCMKYLEFDVKKWQILSRKWFTESQNHPTF